MADREKIQLEYIVKSSPAILFNRLSTPSGLSEWFADNVNNKKGVYSFFWDGSEEKAKMLGKKADEFIKFRWLYDEEDGNDYFFEFRIIVDPLTKEVALVVTDYVEEDEVDESKQLWDTQVDELLTLLGS